jgi:hypothetical protein
MSNEYPTNVFVAPWPTSQEGTPLEQVFAKADTEQAPATADVIDSLDAAAILTVSPNNLRQIVHKKQLTPVGRRGRRTLFARAEVEALAERRRK